MTHQVPQFTVSPTPLPGYEQAGGEMMDVLERFVDSPGGYGWRAIGKWLERMPCDLNRPYLHNVKVDDRGVSITIKAEPKG